MSEKELSPIYEYLDYKQYINDLISTYPKEGRGVFSKLAKSINVSSVLISQIFKGEKDLTIDQAILTSQFFEMKELETEYLITLVSKARAATLELRKYYDQKIFEIQNKSLDIKNRITKTEDISDGAKAEFYSNWLYSGIRLSCALDEISNVKEIAEFFNLQEPLVKEKVDFLLKNGLLKEEDGALQIGVNSTHLGKDNPLVHNHRKNWRLKAIESFANNNANDLFYVAPMVVSEDIAVKLREKILHFIEELYKEVPKEAPETTYCLNIDFFNF